MKKFLPYAYHAWEWKNFENATVSIATHALHYWIWVFGWMRAVPNPENEREFILFRLDKHCKRLSLSAKYLWAEYTPEFIEEKINEFLVKNKPSTPIYLRPLVYTSDLDLSPRLHDIKKDFMLYWMELWDYLSADWITCTISSYMRQSDASFPLRWKISWAYITSALAKTEAVNRWFDDAILLNASNKVSEWSAMNLFMVRGGVIYTPWVTEDILEWITRASVIELARYKWYEVIERQIDKTELFIADEVFMTWTAAKITPVNKIEQYDLPKEKPVYEDLKNAFDEVVSWKNKKFEHWLTFVDLK